MWASLMNLVAPEPTEEEELVSSLQHGRIDGLDAWLSNKGLDALEAVKVGENELNVLHVACYYGNLPAVIKLLEYFPLDKPTKGGNSCCHLAAMGGHSAVASVLLERGAQVTVKNAQGQSVYDVAKGLDLRQKLMVLMLQEEQKNGTAPVIAGVTRDRNQDEARLRDLAPPPTSFPMPAAGPPVSAPNGPHSSAFQPDGFGTTVGRPDLAAKYGNQTQNRLVTDPVNTSQHVHQPWAPPIMAPNARGVSASQRYVVSTPGFNVTSSAPRAASQSMAYMAPRPAGAPRINVFNPGEIADQQQQASVAQHVQPVSVPAMYQAVHGTLSNPQQQHPPVTALPYGALQPALSQQPSGTPHQVQQPFSQSQYSHQQM